MAAACLAFTAGVIAPSVFATGTPPVLQMASMPYRAALIGLIVVALVLRRDAYTGLALPQSRLFGSQASPQWPMFGSQASPKESDT